ncbi:MAG: sulfatase-like hydrolase/transferase [Anaerolineales bacterium]|jgi:arylsulfatase A-like enzyme
MSNKSKLNRREFVKLFSLLPFTYFLPAQAQTQLSPDSKQKNILILVFDALSASNIPLFGYRRNTTPKLLELTKQAIVYHRHYAGGNYTTPGTASLLTGTYPWTHRAIKMRDEVIESLRSRNIFNLFSNHHRFAYTHNGLADVLLNQFVEAIEYKVNRWQLYLITGRVMNYLFSNDADMAAIVDNAAFSKSSGHSYSLFLSRYITKILHEIEAGVTKNYTDLFPRGLPGFREGTWQAYILEDAIDWIKNTIDGLPRPFLGYVHVLPPHFPYRTRRDFIDIFDDGWKPPKKPKLFYKTKGYSEDNAGEFRRQYDEFIAYADAEFYRLFDFLRESGYLENTIVVFTTDHGEIFERGLYRHGHPFLYEPAIHIPLVIFHPDQKERIDVFSPTSAVDLLPTLLHSIGQPIPEWCEGKVLPPFNEETYSSDRNIFALEARETANPSSPFRCASGMIVKGRYKLTKYFGYEELPNGEQIVELFDIENDPEELNNLSQKTDSLTQDLLNELETRMSEADKPYM